MVKPHKQALEVINVTKAYLPPREKLNQYIDRIYKSGWITNNGELVHELEKRLAKHLGVDHLVLVTNGTLALQIAYKTLNLTGEVITTPFSFVATTSSLMWEHLTPVFADIDPATFNIDPKNILKAITTQTSAVLPVHVFGNGCDIEAINEICTKYNIKIIYDAAQAFGVKYKDSSIINKGDASILSFHATKIFHTIEGGAIVFREKKHYENAKLLINFGISGYEKVDILGINAKMNEFQAAIGLCILDDIDDIIAERKKIWERYFQSFENSENLTLQKLNADCSNNYTYFPLVFKSEADLLGIKDALNSKDINPRRYFYPSLNRLRYIDNPVSCENSESIASRILCLPIFPGLDSDIQQRIINTVIETNQ
ncbi:MAG: DegT/DnrJ/EryC1/StrS family aminotransferase [Bacteroidales bacterium]|nr:DegT/DnrJ/EryC1/StrS family aminotransferase [Bacteroidales bacterium]MDZ4203376.1 DegT/DnrJ/EryC1/StrS family aminotransferase [Bacteroidales bacterium]